MSREESDLEKALNYLREQRGFFEKEKPKITDFKQKFALIKEIQECDKEIKRLEAEIANQKQKNSSASNQDRTTRFILPQKDISTFTGRDNELQKLEKQLINRQGNKVCSIVSLAGAGGIGKSALACHFATKYKYKFPDGVIGLRVDGKNADTIVRDFARCCKEEIDPEDERDAATIMQEMFAHRRMLLIFDNADNPTILDLCVGGNRCAIIITTRDRQLPALLDIPIKATIDVRPLPEKDSLQLLKKILGEKRVDDEIEAANKIIRLIGSLPLALQIAGATLRGKPRTLADYAASLKQEKNRLKRLKIRGDKELNVKASLSLSLKLLEKDEIDFFACLSVCAESGFSRRTAAIVGNFDDEYTAQDYLDRFHQLSLLNYSEVGENRFVFHPLIRLFAQELAIERGLKDDAAASHAQFFVEFKSIEIDSSTASLIAEELEDIMLAAKWLQQQQIADYEFAKYIQSFFERNGYWQQAVEFMSLFQLIAESSELWDSVIKFRIQQAKYLSLQGEHKNAEAVLVPIQKLLNKIEAIETRQLCEAKWLNTFGVILRRQNRLHEAVNYLEQALKTEVQLNDSEGLTIVLNTLACVLQQQGKLDKAASTFQRQLKIAQSVDDKRQQTIALKGLAGILQQQGKLDKAVSTFQRQLKIAQTINDTRSIIIALNGLAGVLQQQGKLEEAANTFQSQIEISQSIDDKRSLTFGLNGLAGVLQQQGKLEEAANTFQSQIEISQSNNDKRSLTFGLNGLAGVLQQQGKLEEAANTFQSQIEISQSIDDKRQQAIALNGLAGILQHQGKLEEAANAFRSQIEVAQSIDDKNSVAIGLKDLAFVLQEQKHFQEAINILEQSFDIYEQLDKAAQKAFVKKEIGEALHQQALSFINQPNRLNEAENILLRSQSIFEDLDEKRSLAMVLNSLGVLFKRQQRWKEAEKIIRRSFDLSEKIKDERGQAIVLNSLAQVLQKQRDDKKFEWAIAAFKQSIKIGKKLEDEEHLAKVYTAMGQALITRQKFAEAATELSKGFEIDEKRANIRGLKIVIKKLTLALLKLGERQEAINYCQRALAIEPQNQTFIEIHQKLSSPPQKAKKIILN
ncbi:ATP-dependent transcriptional regulator [Rivularia sp. PCC 7116]|uniref:tetratricopeptide repeat protein n=1 Tax=Rivularia sp. PCC 7116 TaxID=373994 RepID=UPI00029F4794|nr:tetratricopeptide repeat protein [Rivularia sp. PCC 7116]AFY57070.1 ATP-dependent transcriptional regulator [Rivularia sp. PCC 7116]